MVIAFEMSSGPAGAPTAVLLHGLGNSQAMWGDVPERLARQYNVVNLDIPGFGSSATPESGMGIDVVAQKLADFIASEFPGEVRLVGHSLGAIVALRVARLLHTSRLTILVSGFPYSAMRLLQYPRRIRSDPALAANLTAHFLGASVPDLFGLRSSMLKSPSMRKLFLHPFVNSPSAIDPRTLVDALRDTGTPRNLRLAREASEVDLEHDARAVNGPVALVIGDNDRLHRASDLEVFANTGPDRPVVKLRGCGHWPQLENPSLLADTVVGLLADS